MSENPLFSREHMRAVDQRYALKQRRIAEDVARACEAIAGYDHAGTAVAQDAAARIHTALLEYEVALAGASRHVFGDKRRRRARRSLFAQPDPSVLESADGKGYAREQLAVACAKLGQVVGNLEIRTNPLLPKEYQGSDEHDRQFLTRLKPAYLQMRHDLELIGWVVGGGGR